VPHHHVPPSPTRRSSDPSIGDTGPGVDPTILAEIFDPFFTTKPAGTGLGLAIVRKIVEQHAGRVRVESSKGAGTVVRVVLPRHRSAEHTSELQSLTNLLC